MSDIIKIKEEYISKLKENLDLTNVNKLKSELKDNKLPEGTYFYIIKLNNGCPDYKGYLYLRRRN